MEKAQDRLDVLEKIEKYELEGKFDIDPEIDPPAKELLPEDGGAEIGADFDVVGKVLPNVKEFIEMFYSKIYTTRTPKITKEQMIHKLDKVNGNHALRVPQSGLLSDSLFFQYIALLLEQIS